MKIKKGDKVKVITGKYKGVEGIVLKAMPKKFMVIVEGVNIRKKTIKQKDLKSSNNFEYVLHPIHVSNVKLVERLFQKETKNNSNNAENTEYKSE